MAGLQIAKKISHMSTRFLNKGSWKTMFKWKKMENQMERDQRREWVDGSWVKWVTKIGWVTWVMGH